MAELHVSKKPIEKLFGDMQNKKFIIPDYQRPYRWDVEKCETLWNDIENFAVSESNDTDYFLGSIVSYVNNKDNDQEIIDGQQRITSLLLMLRAFYRKLEDMKEDDDVIGLKNQLAKCIWDINPFSEKVSDKSKIHILSQVATEDDNEIFHKILETGESEQAQDNYSKNYQFFKSQCDKYAQKNPMQWKQLCVTILKRCIVLPIECVTQETALTIFSTLNDRGMPLADSDIFKAQFYRNCSTIEKKKEFTSTWKDITQICKEANIPLDSIFRYYTHVLRARNDDRSKEIGLRSFYAGNNYERLRVENFIDEISVLANFWKYVNTGVNPEDGYEISFENRMYLHCLSCYPNDYWKYIVSVFFIKNKENGAFEQNMNMFLKKITAFLFAKFIEHPTVNAIKDDVFVGCISIQKENNFQVNSVLNKGTIEERIGSFSSSKIARALLLLDAYLNPSQKKLISQTVEVEHILPKKWQNTNYNGWTLESAQEYIDKFGNKMVIEKKLNIQAGNGYFGQKKIRYGESEIENVKELSKLSQNDWSPLDINDRETKFRKRIVDFFEKHIPEQFA
jgi:uncharacterized protein with ParB-like and HNH nuclease domain